ncbi:hypothetical protein [Paraburkholderia tropica]|uniref:hypothetical protein n=2 Tax=Paraburkholderia tropica TaxID=92647 RepID=UPI000A6D3AD4|nr:hypothetical protein [Paraburkholderia tropica]MBB2979310.1 hypothetical protein [Paraburkholderia tropica]
MTAANENECLEVFLKSDSHDWETYASEVDARYTAGVIVKGVGVDCSLYVAVDSYNDSQTELKFFLSFCLDGHNLGNGIPLDDGPFLRRVVLPNGTPLNWSDNGDVLAQKMISIVKNNTQFGLLGQLVQGGAGMP